AGLAHRRMPARTLGRGDPAHETRRHVRHPAPGSARAPPRDREARRRTRAVVREGAPRVRRRTGDPRAGGRPCPPARGRQARRAVNPVSDPILLTVAAHPALLLRGFTAEFARPLGELPSSALAACLPPAVPAPLDPPDDVVRARVRDLLRHGRSTPTGRSKPSREYLARAAVRSAGP